MRAWTIVAIQGDIKDDYNVDVYDALLLAGAYNSRPVTSSWNPNAGITGDNVVDIYDAIVLSNNLGRKA